MERHNFVPQLVLICLLFLIKMCVSGANHHQAAIGSAEQSKGIQITHRYSSTNTHQILPLDQDRVNSMNSIASNNKYNTDNHGEDTNLPLFGRSLGAGNYLVTVGFGTPKRDYKLIFDTGSELTWIQCLPCAFCYEQDDQIFDPSKSSTFSNASCKAAASCDYHIAYGDKSFSSGYYARETLTISPTEVFPNVVFGCGENNSKSFGKAAGLLGLGGDVGLSLMAQTSTSFAKIFCYCLPRSESSTGYLMFGIQALETCQTNNFTPLLSSDPNRPYLYFVNLLGITVGNQRLKISSTNTILDSGTVISRLPPSVFSELGSVFTKSMSGYPTAPPVLPLLSTCYNLEGYQNFTAPKMVLHFDKVSVDLEPEAVIWVENPSQVCLAFAANKDDSELTIIGNHQQRMLNILYDINERKVEFGAGGCGN